METVQVGKIVNTHGLKGEVKVFSFSDEPERFKLFKKVIVKQGSTTVEYKIESVKVIKNTAVLQLTGILNIDMAESLKGSLVFVDEIDVPILPDDCFYVKDLIGCEIMDSEVGTLGVISDVVSTGSNDVYIVKRPEKADLLVPALKSVVKNVDLTRKAVTVILPDGLLEIYE